LARKKPSCFAIMPFGKKPVGRELIDFDCIWKQFIEPAALAAGFEVSRVDEDLEKGHISENMIRHIKEADVAVADLTYHNPNVYYELGMRHALARHGTVLIKRDSGDMDVADTYPDAPPALLDNIEIPFDLRQMAHFFYQMTPDKLEQNRETLTQSIIARYNAREPDSPVYTYLDDLRFTYKTGKASGRQDRDYHVLDEAGERTGKKIGFRSGDIANLRPDRGNAIDYWVNSENTLMQMARIHENAISATIRYHGGLNPDTRLHTDLIQNELTKKLGNRPCAEAGEVLVTGSGFLRKSHGVKAILHAASVAGKPCSGFQPIGEQATIDCVHNVIDKARSMIRSGNDVFAGKSLILPIFGAGQGQRDPATIAGQVIYAVMEDLRFTPPDLEGRDLELVVFNAYSEDDLGLMRRLFEAYRRDGELEATSP